LVDGLVHDDRICSNYSTKYVEKTSTAIKNFKGGKAVYTFPPMPIKCPGAPQKIMWISNDIWKNNSTLKNKYTLEYNTALGKGFLFVIFNFFYKMIKIFKVGKFETIIFRF
jgi:hypothetical protein